MNKRSLVYFIPCFISLFLYGCINYTNTDKEGTVPSRMICEEQEEDSISGYTDFRKPIKDVTKESKIASSIATSTDIKRDEYPIISYSGYEVMYNPEYKIPRWVRYELISSETDGPYSRKGLKFCQDLSANVQQADDSDYKNSGWSKGHMAPAADFKWSSQAMIETFYYTNCCPQNQSLNAGQWNTLEKKAREWANRYGCVTVVTGPLVLNNEYGTIGNNKIVVPNAFFKTILAGEQAIAFVMYNHNNNENMQKCAMSVDDLETISGIDFFSELDDDIEIEIESTFTLKYWNL